MRNARLIAAVLTTVLALSACSGGDDESTADAPEVTAKASDDSGSGSPEESPSTSPPQSALPTEEAPAGPTIEVRIEGDKVAPNAEELSLAVNETLVWNITSDRAGELHVHSKPEQFVEFGEGETRAEMTVETPGSVEVEDHETSAVVAILEVR
ncbi:hypothetical protein I601_4104 [Nocardioides dokdonensis FR1436]|uniref:Uncharacterized protein n=1 Tax=Nocardioides dokdonensis FR1436 TaxID=1300347 RepID=A0A1A9GQC2_9ACTN|nr:hypothetical protein [Nocardioides dokdonensis]ANH40499.1 hypothetical protein I601_4104 [Nocardioides dokdonensis FR1436]